MWKSTLLNLPLEIRSMIFVQDPRSLWPLATSFIKRQIQKAIRDALITGFEYIDGQLVAVHDHMESAEATEGASHTDALKDISLVYS